MSSDKYIPTSDGKEIINPDGSSILRKKGNYSNPDWWLLFVIHRDFKLFIL